MMPLSPDTLVIFDYSGTLSLEAPAFARPANLIPALAKCGLAELGIATPESFWGGIVFPTWEEGSTTPIGYKRLIARRVAALGQAPGATVADIEAASSRFVDRYLAHSRIAPLWRTLLIDLTGNPAVCVVIATDHYAEATGAIRHHLDAWKIPSRTVNERKEGREPLFPTSCIVANSADVGFWKVDRRFWSALRRRLAIPVIRSILLIDDFGFNEEKEDRYREEARVEARRRETSASIEEVFQIPPEVIPFYLGYRGQSRRETGAVRIAETVHRIEAFLHSRDAARRAP